MLNILLVDDDVIEFRLIERMLKDCYEGEFLLRYANTAEKAVTIMKTQKIDIVLLDDKLDDGRTALDSVPVLKGVSEAVPLVLISSNINAEYLTDKTILNVFDIIDKFDLRKRIKEGLFES